MGMLNTLLRNLIKPVRTRPPAGMPATPPRYRGALTHDASLCTACGTCAYVCAPKAISFEVHADQSVSWKFYIGQCSFCGLCEQNCPTAAIGNSAQLPGTTLNTRSNGLRLESRIHRVACTRCGKPHLPLPAALQARLLAGKLSGAAEAEQAYCPDCRGHASSERLRLSFQSPTAPGAGETGEPA